jgi:NADH:quinone reductase (non-electrogenic)
MLKTRLTELLGIEVPVIQGGLHWLATADLAGPVSEAGGLGIITSLSFPDCDALRSEIRRLRSMTAKPFGVNVSMLPELTEKDRTEEIFEVVIGEKVPVVETAGRSPEPYVDRLHKAGIKVIHKVPSVRFAQKAEAIGVDAVTVVGFECGGHPGMDDVTTFVLIPRAADAVKIPVIAGGGIADARGLIAALALGAEGVVMGTRFVATHECPAHERIKEWYVNAKETDTMMVMRSIKNAARAMKNDAAKKCLAMEARKAPLDELMTVISGELGRKALYEGDLDGAIIASGECVGLIHEIKKVKEIFEDMASGSEAVFQRLRSMVGA